MAIQALKGKVLVTDLDNGEQVLESGIIIQDDNKKTTGVHPRWAKVHSIGEGVTGIEVGEYVLVDTGRWSRTIEVDGLKVNLIDYPKGVLLAATERPNYLGYNPIM